MDLYVCEKCFVVREEAGRGPPPDECPACGTSGSMVEAYVAERFTRPEPAVVSQVVTRPQM